MRAALARFDGEGLGVEPARYDAVAEELRTLPAPVELARLFQVDLVKPARAATLGEPVLAELVRGVELLQRLSRRREGDRSSGSGSSSSSVTNRVKSP